MHLQTIISLALLFLVTVMQCQAFVTSMSRGVYHPNQTIIFDERTFKNPRLLYAVCDSSNKCRLEHDREPFQRPTDTCQVTLDSDGEIDKIRIIPFSNNKAILVWIDKMETVIYFNLLGIRFGDCWKLKARSSFDYNNNIDFTFQPSLATYENSYDVFFVNSKICGNNYCKLSVNFETNQIQGPMSWTPVTRDLIADIIPLGSASEKLLLVQFSGTISVVNGDGRTILKPREPKFNTSFGTLSYSINNNFIGVCELKTNTLSSSQFNYLGVKTFETASHVDSAFVLKAAYNLPDGGMLVLLSEQDTDFQRILKLNTEGTQIGRLVIRIRCAYPRAAQFFEKNDRYCVSVTCFDNSNYNKNHLEVVARCFSLNDIRAV